MTVACKKTGIYLFYLYTINSIILYTVCSFINSNTSTYRAFFRPPRGPVNRGFRQCTWKSRQIGRPSSGVTIVSGMQGATLPTRRTRSCNLAPNCRDKQTAILREYYLVSHKVTIYRLEWLKFYKKRFILELYRQNINKLFLPIDMNECYQFRVSL